MSNEPFCQHLMLLGFHHTKGPIVEQCIPPLPTLDTKKSSSKDESQTNEFVQLPTEWEFLPFCGLPDGAHLKQCDETFFSLPPLLSLTDNPKYHTTFFGVGSFRQIESEKVANKTSDIQRTYIQKALVVITTLPATGFLHPKINQVMEVFFDQKDFQDQSILQSFFDQLHQYKISDIPKEVLYMDLGVQQLVKKFQTQSIILFKLLLLQKKVLIYGSSMTDVGNLQLALISLIPSCLENLQNGGSYELTNEEPKEKNQFKSVENFVDQFIPSLFNQGAVFQPCLSLQQSSALSQVSVFSYLAGTTNQLLPIKKGLHDVIINVDQGSIGVSDLELRKALMITSADLKFINDLCLAVDQQINLNDGSFKGSDDHIRQSFHDYLKSLVSCLLYSKSPLHELQDPEDLIDSEEDSPLRLLNDFNLDFVEHWTLAPNFEPIKAYLTDPITPKMDSVYLKHPGHGATVMNDISIRLSSQFRNMKLPDFKPVVGKLNEATTQVVKAFDGIQWTPPNFKGTATQQREGNGGDPKPNPTQEISHAWNRAINSDFSKNASQQAQKWAVGINSFFQNAKTQMVNTMKPEQSSQSGPTIAPFPQRASKETNDEPQKKATEDIPVIVEPEPSVEEVSKVKADEPEAPPSEPKSDTPAPKEKGGKKDKESEVPEPSALDIDDDLLGDGELIDAVAAHEPPKIDPELFSLEDDEMDTK